MATVIACPHCQRNLQLPEEALARPVQCPGCGGTFETSRSALERGTAPSGTVPKLVVEEAEVLPAPIRGVPPPPGPLRPVLLSSSREPGAPPSRMPDLAEPAEPGGMERCPGCRARVTRGMAQCPACGARLRGDEDRPWEQRGGPLRRDCEPHRGPLIVTLGRLCLCLAVPGLLGVAYLPFALASLVALGLGLAVSLMARDDLAQMRRQEMDPEGEASTVSGQTCSSIGLIIGLVGLLLAGLLRLPMIFN